jgi:hypothetical protein
MEVELLKHGGAKKAKKLTKASFEKIAIHHMKKHGFTNQHVKHLKGSGFFSDLWDGLKEGVSQVASVVKPLIKPAMGAFQGFQQGGPAGALMGALSSLGGAKPSKKVVQYAFSASPKQQAHYAKMKVRGQKVKKLMKEGLTFAEANQKLAKKKSKK